MFDMTQCKIGDKLVKQKAFDEAYEKWAATRRPEVYIWGSGYAEYSIQAYKKWLWEQKSEEAQVFKDLMPWWKYPSLGNFKVALYTSNTPTKPGYPIKSTYTFWLGANGEIVDDK